MNYRFIDFCISIHSHTNPYLYSKCVYLTSENLFIYVAHNTNTTIVDPMMTSAQFSIWGFMWLWMVDQRPKFQYTMKFHSGFSSLNAQVSMFCFSVIPNPIKIGFRFRLACMNLRIKGANSITVEMISVSSMVTFSLTQVQNLCKSSNF